MQRERPSSSGNRALWSYWDILWGLLAQPKGCLCSLNASYTETFVRLSTTCTLERISIQFSEMMVDPQDLPPQKPSLCRALQSVGTPRCLFWVQTDRPQGLLAFETLWSCGCGLGTSCRQEGHLELPATNRLRVVKLLLLLFFFFLSVFFF